jgi:1,4-dihydroxy-2-naphthoate octaprenyltransferase
VSDDDDLAKFEESERQRTQKIYRRAALFWAALGALALFVGLVAKHHPAFVWVGAIALLIAAMYASGRSFTTLI